MDNKDWDRAAAVIFKQKLKHQAEIIETFRIFFRGDSPEFDEGKFVRACVEGPGKRA